MYDGHDESVMASIRTTAGVMRAAAATRDPGIPQGCNRLPDFGNRRPLTLRVPRQMSGPLCYARPKGTGCTTAWSLSIAARYRLKKIWEILL